MARSADINENRLVDIVITNSVIMTALIGVLCSPVFVLAWRRERLDTIRNFAIGSVFIGVLCGFIAMVSHRQVAQCIEAGNSDCVDSGAVGLQVLLVGLFVVASWVVSWTMWRS